MRILGLADDMTGALELGAKFAPFGSLVSVLPESAFDLKAPAIVIDTETRHVTAAEAEERVHGIALAARTLPADMIYKKTDSTLRGNIGSELNALGTAFSDRCIIFAPGYPRLGRTVRRGHLHVHGEPVHQTGFARDALNPVTTSYIPAALQGCELPVVQQERIPAAGLAPGRVYVFDVETEWDVARIAEAGLRQSPWPVFCGSANLAEHLTALLQPTQTVAGPLPMMRNCLVVNGSRHEVSLQQIRHAQCRGWRTLPPAELLDGGDIGWTILATDSRGGASARETAARTGEFVREVLHTKRLDGLIVFGGDTVFGILQACQQPTVTPIRELLAGVALSRWGDVHLVTKAGGFGAADVLEQVREILSGGR